MAKPAPPDKQPDDQWSQVGLALSIPTLMVSGPLVGYFLGVLVQHWTGWGNWVKWTLLVLGAVAGVREVIKVIKRLS